MAEIVQKHHFDTRLTAPEGKTGAPCLATFFICAGSSFVHLINQVARLSVLGDFGLQPRVKVGFLSNITQYFCRKIDFTPARDFGNLCSSLKRTAWQQPGSALIAFFVEWALLQSVHELYRASEPIGSHGSSTVASSCSKVSRCSWVRYFLSTTT